MFRHAVMSHHRHGRGTRRSLAAIVALVALVASTLALAAPAQAEPDPRPRALLLASDATEYIQDVKNKLVASGAFAEVDIAPEAAGCSLGVPVLADLLAYDSVHLWTDCGVNDPEGLGDVLADYVDAGGRLVVSVFATGVQGLTPEGRLRSGGYLPVASGSYTSGPRESLVADLPDHPLLQDVRNFDGGDASYRGTGLDVTEGSTLVAHWSSGEPLVAVRGNVVFLNFFPPSSDVGWGFWDAATDGAQLMVNALSGSTIERALRFTSAESATFAAGTAGSFTVATAGRPAAAITQTGTLPSGLTFTDNGDGTATLAGTPAAGSGGTSSLALTADNGLEPDATQTLAVTVNEAPVVTSLPSAGFTVGDSSSFTVTSTAGFPTTTTLTRTGDLPTGMTFTDNGDGTATVAGTPADGSAGSYPITVKAANTALSSTQELTLTVSLAAQAVTITSTPPAAVVGQAYAVIATGGASENPVVVSIAPASSEICAVDGTTVTFQHPGSCVISADQAGDGRYAAASATQTVAVTAAATTTKLTVDPDRLTATVVPTAPGAGAPTGTVTFSVDGAAVGTSPLVRGTATLSHKIAAGKSRAVAATYSGDDDFSGSSSSTARRDPSITARVSSSKAKSAFGWYRTPVKVTFRCTTAGAPLAGTCPKPVTLKANRAGQSVSRTILAADGGAATVTVGGISIDRVAPKVSVKGVRQGATYPGQAPKARCVGKDAVSGVARCTITKRASGEKVTVTAKATDRAGNTRTSTVRYTVDRFYVAGATYRNGAYQVRGGKTYLVVALSKGTARPQYYNAALRGSTPTASGTYLNRSGKQAGLRRHTVGVRIDRGMSRRGDWVLGVKSGGTLHRIAIHVRR